MDERTLSENTSRTIGKDAQRNNILAAKLIADIVKTTLGPKGMDKMLVDSSNNITVTNDGVTILEEMEIDHPAAKMMVEIAKTQENEVGDGTTTVALLAGKLLENAENLLNKKIHPTLIVKGYKIAAKKCLEILNEISLPIKSREILKNLAMTAMTGKGAEGNKEYLSELIVQAIEQISSETITDLDNIKIEKIPGEKTEDSQLIKGIVLNKERSNQEMPSQTENAKILLIDFPLELKGPETETKIEISNPEQLQSFIESEERYLKSITEKIISSGANVVFCQKGIDDVAQYYLAKSKIMAFRRVPKSDLEKLAKASSAKIISNINDISQQQLGSAKRIDEIKHGDSNYTYITGCENPRAVTIMIRGGTSHVIDETERAIKDGLGDVSTAIKSGKVVAGGGAVEIELARRLRQFSQGISGREQLALEEFAKSIESIPETLAENAGLDPIEIITQLKKAHDSAFTNYGLNLFNERIEDTFQAGIIEPLKVKTQAISSATDLATMILRIDDVLISKPKQEKESKFDGLD
jgi:thermosome